MLLLLLSCFWCYGPSYDASENDLVSFAPTHSQQIIEILVLIQTLSLSFYRHKFSRTEQELFFSMTKQPLVRIGTIFSHGKIVPSENRNYIFPWQNSPNENRNYFFHGKRAPSENRNYFFSMAKQPLLSQTFSLSRLHNHSPYSIGLL